MSEKMYHCDITEKKDGAYKNYAEIVSQNSWWDCNKQVKYPVNKSSLKPYLSKKSA